MQHGKSLPYSKPLAALQRDGFRPNEEICLYIGKKAWDKGFEHSLFYPETTLVLPAWHTPEDYFYPVNDCCVCIFDSSFALDEYIDDLAGSLFRDGAKVAIYFPPFSENITVIRKEA